MTKTAILSPLAALVIIVASAAVMIDVSLQESAIMDELAHIPAGYGYVKYFDYRLNPEHPPLVKAFAAFPLLFQKLNFPTDKSPWQTDVNGQWAAGAQFFYESGNNADKIIFLSRIGPIILTLILLLLIYLWAKELLGRSWALLPTFLFAFSPTVLAHGHYVTTDIGAALGIVLAVYFFVKFLLNQTRRNLIFAGLIFGFAQLMKFSAVLLIPYFIFLLAAFYLYSLKRDFSETAPPLRFRRFFFRFLRYLKNIFLVFIIGLAFIYAVYFVFTLNYPLAKQRADTEFILASFSGGPDPNRETCRINSNIDFARRTRCVAEINIWMTENKLLRPLGQYLLGVLMVLQRSTGGNTGYFLGEVSAAGWWYYFPVVFALKEPIPSLILIGLALLFGVWRIIKNLKPKALNLKSFSDYLGTHFAEFSMISFVIFYWAYSIASPLNIGVRHILPTLPFLYILAAGVVKNSIPYPVSSISYAKLLIVSVVVVWYLLETVFAYPYYLSYFNQFGGGTAGGWRYVADSNYDWGQDLKRLKKFVEENGVEKIAVDYFGGGNPKYYFGEKAEHWQSARGNPKNEGIEWLAVSVNTLLGATGKLAPGQPRRPEDEYQWLRKLRDPYKPDAKAGTSIFIYRLTN